MPAKRKPLPMPCPKCELENGTVQVQIFDNDYSSVYCRVWHYNSSKYKKSREKTISKIVPFISLTSEQHAIRKYKDPSRGKKSCNFRIDEKFALENIPSLDQDIKDLTSGYFGSRKGITYTNPSLLLEAIKDEGWHRVLSFKEKARIMYEKYGHIKGYLPRKRLWEQLDELEAKNKTMKANSKH